MLLALLGLHGAHASEVVASDVVGFRRDVYYVVDAFVAKRVDRVGRRRVVRYAVFWDRRPPAGSPGRVVRSEWAVVDGTGRLLNAAQFHALSGHVAEPADRRNPRRTWLDGVQVRYDRRDVEAWADEREWTACRRRGVTGPHADALREGVVSRLPGAEWSGVAPGSLD
ncbi:MAG: hypothetical protein R3F59_17355 [Myxococcota bacterium]